jgi:hypothetical protein
MHRSTSKNGSLSPPEGGFVTSLAIAPAATLAGNSVVSGQSWRSLNTVGGDPPIPSTILRGAELMSGIPDFKSKVRPFYLKSPERRVRQARPFIGRIYSFYLKPFRPLSTKRPTRLLCPYSSAWDF